MRWFAASAFILAIIVKTAWHSSIELGFPVNSTTDIGYPISAVAFWFLLAIALLFFLGHLLSSRDRRRR